MPLDNYTCFTLPHYSFEAFSEYIKQIDNLERLSVIGSHFDYNIKLRIIVNRKIEVAFNQGYNIGLANNNMERLM